MAGLELVIDGVGAPQRDQQPPVGLAADGLLVRAAGLKAEHAQHPQPRVALILRTRLVTGGEANEVRGAAAVLAAHDAVAVVRLLVMALEVAAARPPREDRRGAVDRALLEDRRDGVALVADGALGRLADDARRVVIDVVEEVVLLAAGAVDAREQHAAGEVPDGLLVVVAVLEALGAARAHVGANASVDVQRAIPATADQQPLDDAPTAADELRARRRPVGFAGARPARGQAR